MSAMTVRQILALPPRPSPYNVDRNLYIRVREGRKGRINRAWLFRFYDGAKPRWRGLGPLHLVPLAEARDATIDHLRQIRKEKLGGTVPAAPALIARPARPGSAKVKAVSFRACAEAYYAAHEPSWRNAKHRQQWRMSLDTYLLPVLGDKPVGTIETADVLEVIQPLWATKTETASRLRGRIEVILDYAKAQGHRSGENPARWRGHLDHLLPSPTKVAPVEHLAAVPYTEVPQLVAALADYESTAARAIEFITLTACRLEEACGARWAEIDLNAQIWSIPASRTKSGRGHRVALPGAAIRLLEGLPREGEHVFPGEQQGQPIRQDAVYKLFKALAPHGTVHGLRSAFRTWVTEQTEFPDELGELALGHAVGTGVARAYQRGDALARRFALAEAWAAHVGAAA